MLQNPSHMVEAFGIVVFVVVGLAVVVGLLSLRGRGGSYDEIGGMPAATAGDDRDAEIRQLVAARNARRERRGEPPLDVEAEIARLGRAGAGDGAAASVDPELRAEVRALVEARNVRRVRAGDAPLDVEAETARELRRLEGA
jgi:hypothetical protein